jgi:hypothetical protein
MWRVLLGLTRAYGKTSSPRKSKTFPVSVGVPSLITASSLLTESSGVKSLSLGNPFWNGSERHELQAKASARSLYE